MRSRTAESADDSAFRQKPIYVWVDVLYPLNGAPPPFLCEQIFAILSTMISVKSDYKHSSVSRIPVEGEIIPVRDNRVLKAEDASFLAEAAYDRASVLLGWPQTRWWYPGPEYDTYPEIALVDVNPVDVTNTDFSLVLAQEGRRPFPEIAKLFHAAAYYAGHGGTEQYEFMRYVDPSFTKVVADKVLDNAKFTNLIPEKRFRTIEENLLEELGLKPQLFSAKAKNSPDEDWRSRPLDLVGIRNAYSDVKNLRRLIVPCTTTSVAVCNWQESEYDQDPNTGNEYSVNLVVNPISQSPAFDFSILSCFCTVPNEGASTSTLYMSEKSVYYGDNQSPCCADWMNVTPSGYDISLEPTCGCDKTKLDVERIYILFRAWRWNLDGMEYDTLDAKTYLTSESTSKWEISSDIFSLEKCKRYLSKSGFPEECERQHDGETSIRHIAKVGVDIVGIYALAHLKDPPVKTDIWDLGWNP